MSTKSSIKFGDIIKRSTCINSKISESVDDSERLFSQIQDCLENCKTGKEAVLQQKIRSYIESMCDVSNASKYYYRPFELIESLNKLDTNVSNMFVHEYINRILPYTEIFDISDFDDYINDDQKEIIRESINLYNAADRIIANHDGISKRFNIENEVKRYQSVGLKFLVDSCAELIDTYKIRNYQKLNIVIEEVSYVLDKNGIEYSKKELAEEAVKYFLCSEEYLFKEDIRNYKRTIEMSYILNEEDSSAALSILDADNDTSSINNTIKSFLVMDKKEYSLLANMILDCLSKTTKADIIVNIDKLLYLIWDVSKSHESYYITNNNICDTLTSICNYIIHDKDKEYTLEEIDAIINKMQDIYSNIKYNGNYNSVYSNAANEFITSLNSCIIILKNAKDLLYPATNLEAIRFVNNTDVEEISLNEFKTFKFHNLVRSSFNFDKFLKVKEKKIYDKAVNKIKNNLKKAKDTLFGESVSDYNIYNYIGDDCKVDICIRQYECNESNIEFVSEFASSACNSYNEVLTSQNHDTIRAYYITYPNLVEIRLKESTAINLEDDDKEIAMHSFDESIDVYINMVYESNNICNNIDSITDTEGLVDKLIDFSRANNFTMEHYKLALEAMKYISIDKETIKLFAEKFADYNFSKAIDDDIIDESCMRIAKEEKLITEAANNFEQYTDVPFDIQLEAYNCLLAVLEDANEDDDEDDDDEEDDEDESSNSTSKKPEPSKPASSANDKNDDSTHRSRSSKINLTNIKLGLKGIATKFKDFSTKEKEICRNVDNAARAFTKAARDSITNNRREAIIKGTLIPSFSRCIKSGILIAGIGYFSVTAAVITAMGAIGMNSKLNKKERLLILDEIETELEVVDKEIQIAESDNNMKKYRALLNYKKQLQRQYQRIKYNIRVGKDIVDSNTGMRSKD